MLIEQLDKNIDMITANKWRMASVRGVQGNDLDEIMNKLEGCFKSGENVKIKSFLEAEMFFERVDEMFISELKTEYYKHENKLLQQLKESYIKMGVKGIRFAWGHLLC